MIRANGLSKAFGRNSIVWNITFEVAPGEVFGLLGPNGAGKTTTLRMLSTTLQPTEGTAVIAGYDVRRDPEAVRANIGVLPTDPGLYGRLTPVENLRFYGRLCGMRGPSLERRIDELLEWLELTDARDRPTDNFSKGMKQKVALARAVLHDPPVLILDEPTAGLDVLSARSVIEFISASKDAGRAVLFCSHYLLEADRVCDRLAILAGGEICTVGTPDEVRREVNVDTLEDAFAHWVEVRERPNRSEAG